MADERLCVTIEQVPSEHVVWRSSGGGYQARDERCPLMRGVCLYKYGQGGSPAPDGGRCAHHPHTFHLWWPDQLEANPSLPAEPMIQTLSEEVVNEKCYDCVLDPEHPEPHCQHPEQRKHYNFRGVRDHHYDDNLERAIEVMGERYEDPAILQAASEAWLRGIREAISEALPIDPVAEAELEAWMRVQKAPAKKRLITRGAAGGGEEG